MRGIWLRLARLVRRRKSEREIDEELRFHVDMETDAYVTREGLDPAEARRRALLAFGGEERWREETRGTRGTGWLEDAVRDARLAGRGLIRSPGFALASLATITLGVGATTAIFSVVRGVLLAPLPYPEPDELVTVWMSNPAQGIDEDITSWPNFTDWRARGTTLEHMAAVRTVRFALTGAGEAEEVVGAAVSRGFFELVGAPLALGRGFRETEVELAGDGVQVVVLSHELFTRRFGADPALLGRTIQLNDEAYEVVGVTAPGRGYPSDAELWTPLSFTGDLAPLREARGALWLPVVGRLADGVDLSVAQAEMDAVAGGLRETYPDVNEGVGITLEPLRETLVGDVRSPLLVLLGAVAVVLLMAVVNVANLLLARGMARARELVVRLTLGAGRGRLVRQVLAESLVLGVVGGMAGAALAALSVNALVAAAAVELPRLDEVRTDGAVLAFALATSLAASLFFGLLPALHAGRGDAGSQLREGARGSSGRGLARVRGAFVIGQFALALLLLVGSSLLVRSFLNLRAVDPGFEPEGVLSATISLPPSRYPDDPALSAFRERLEAELSALPGVARVGTVSTLFLSALPNMGGIAIEGREELGDLARQNPVVRDMVTDGFFEAAGIDLRSGRAFGPADGPDAIPVAVVNETFARVFFPAADPIGERFTWGTPDADATWFTIVGVARDARRSGLDRPIRPSAFVSSRQYPPGRMDVLLRAESGDPLALVAGLRRSVRGIDAQLPLTRVRTLEQAMSESLGQRRFVAGLLTAFAAVALALAAVGIFGVMAYVVGQRSREIGIRVALGAQRSTVLRRTLGEGMAYAGIGLGLGGLASLALTRYVRGQLFGLEATDPASFAWATGVLLAAAALACLLPARRAASVDPLAALREE